MNRSINRNIAVFVVVALLGDVVSPRHPREPHPMEAPFNQAVFIPAPAQVTTTLAAEEKHFFSWAETKSEVNDEGSGNS